MYCKKCGAFLKDGAKFCTSCGEAVQNSENAYDDYEQTGILENNEFDASDDFSADFDNKGMFGQTDYQTQPQPQPQPQPQAGGQYQAYGAQNFAADISFSQAFKNFWVNYVNFSGRARRKEYWYIVLWNITIYFVFSLIIMAVGTVFPPIAGLLGGILSIYGIASIIPGISLFVRRLHDTSKAWYYMLFSLIPFAGSIIALVFMCQDSTPGANNWGENPKGINNPFMQTGYAPAVPYTTGNAYNANASAAPIQSPNVNADVYTNADVNTNTNSNSSSNTEGSDSCKYCGAKLNQNTDFCSNCGMKK